MPKGCAPDWGPCKVTKAAWKLSLDSGALNSWKSKATLLGRGGTGTPEVNEHIISNSYGGETEAPLITNI